jgi:hypothetical protein
MEWNGMEWNGMEWNGMEWNGMEWIEIDDFDSFVCVKLMSSVTSAQTTATTSY